MSSWSYVSRAEPDAPADGGRGTGFSGSKSLSAAAAADQYVRPLGKTPHSRC
jgi:hypothetical protein